MERREIECVPHTYSYFSFSFEKFQEKGGSHMARSSRLESGFQDKVRKELLEMFPGSMVLKMDQFQGIPDLLILHEDKWASLECKRSAKEKKQPNQEYYVGLMDEMSFSRFICPENKEEVLSELSEAFRTSRSTRVSRRK